MSESTTIVPVDGQSSVTVDAALVVATDQAFATNRVLDGSSDHGFGAEWSEAAVMPDGRKCHRMYLFTDDEIQAAGEYADQLPWDDNHVHRIDLAN